MSTWRVLLCPFFLSTILSANCSAAVLTADPVLTGYFTESKVTILQGNGQNSDIIKVGATTTPSVTYSSYSSVHYYHGFPPRVDASNQQFESRFNLEFLLPTLSTGMFISSAILEWSNSTEGGNRPLELLGYIGDGAISTSDFQGGSLISQFSPGNATNEAFAFDVTDFIASLYLSSSEYAGFYVHATSKTTNDSTYDYYIENDYTGVNSHPTLSITYVPEPPSVITVSLSSIMAIGVASYRMRSH